MSFAQAADPPLASIKFTPEETAFINNAGAIKMCVDPDWAPFERINQRGRHEGIAADLVQLVAQRVGLKIELYPTKSWEESLASSRLGLCHILSFLNQSPERDQWLIFTDPIFLDPNVIITREEHAFIADLDNLREKTVALPRGTMIEELIRNNYPKLNIITTDNEEEAVALVSERKADMTMRSLIVAAYAIKKEGLFNLKIAGQIPEYTNRLRIGVKHDQFILRDILDKGVKTISQEEREAISNKHVSTIVHKGIDYDLVWKIILFSGFILALTLYWNRKLSLLNKELERLSITDKLTGLFNRIRLDQKFAEEIRRATRSSQPFSIVLLDIDHFKKINDTHGHQTGDKVLVDIAKVLKNNTRDIDLVGRWGGEEFLIICPQTEDKGGLTLAENLRQLVENNEFPIVQKVTASFGVTSYRIGDHANDMIARADAALYLAKHRGRNRVENSKPAQVL